MANGVFANDDAKHGAQLDYEGKRNLYNELLENPKSIGENKSLSNFVLGSEGSVYDKLHRLDKGISEYWNNPKLLQSAQVLYASINKLQVQINQKDSLFALKKKVKADSVSILKAKFDLIRQINAKFTVWSNLQSSVRNQAKALASVWQDYNASIETSSIPAYNEVAVNAVILEMLANGATLVNDEQFETIAHIALQCPNEGGAAVYRARTLYRTK